MNKLKGKKVFVFVVCGKREYMDMLHYSLQALKCYTHFPVIVVTDFRRNQNEIEHDQVIHVETPNLLTNQQASIFLKTGLYKILPKGNLYCYLDADVIALSEECNHIFDQFIEPIRFAPDHCKLRKFSASAVNCRCIGKREPQKAFLDETIRKINNSRFLKDCKTKKDTLDLLTEFTQLNDNPMGKFFCKLRFISSKNKFYFADKFYFDKQKLEWKNMQGETIFYEVTRRKIEMETGFRFDESQNTWVNSDGDDVCDDGCDALKMNIKDKFGIDIQDSDWQHWNGGVFVFNDKSKGFLASWHQKSLAIFRDKKWRSRDQGTLIATAWQFGLHNHPLLDKKWNFIADYNNSYLRVNNEGYFSDDTLYRLYKPAFVHVYHHFGDRKWQIWNKIESILKDYEMR